MPKRSATVSCGEVSNDIKELGFLGYIIHETVFLSSPSAEGAKRARIYGAEWNNVLVNDLARLFF